MGEWESERRKPQEQPKAQATPSEDVVSTTTRFGRDHRRARSPSQQIADAVSTPQERAHPTSGVRAAFPEVSGAASSSIATAPAQRTPSTFPEIESAIATAHALTISASNEQQLGDAKPALLGVQHRLAMLRPIAVQYLGSAKGEDAISPALFDRASAAVNDWLRLLDSDAQVDADALLAQFRIGAPAVRAATQAEALKVRPGKAPGDIARAGVAGANKALPHLARIQQSFGRHDISNVRAAVGGNAADASKTLGARAFAIESNVGFADAPDLHTAAHEAAHTVQQREGVHLAGGVDVGAGDPLEQHADRVADAVVAGRSAESLLDKVPASGGKSSGVQRKTEGSESHDPAPKATGRADVAWAYLRANESKFLEAFGRRLASVPLPTHARVTLAANGIGAQLATSIAEANGQNPLFITLPELMHPSSPWFIIDQHRVLTEGTAGITVDGREPTGPLTWAPLAGDALAIDFATRFQESLARMLPRYATQLDARNERVQVDDLVAGHPMDRVCARLLCDERVCKPNAKAKPARGHKATNDAAADPKQFREGVRFIQDYHWLGDTDPNLWNWIEVRDIRDATPEDVAATLWADPQASFRAYGITGSAPFFRVDPGWARKFSDAEKHAPKTPVADNGELALASSGLATDAAIAQAAGERHVDKRGAAVPANVDRLSELLDRSFRQLERVKDDLAAMKLWPLVLPAINWVSAHREHITAIPENRLALLAPVIEGQQEILFEAVAAVGEIVHSAGAALGVEGANGPVGSAVKRYATAIGESHLIEMSRVELAKARAEKADLPFALLAQSARDTMGAANELRGNETRMAYGGAEAVAAVGAEQREVVELRAKQVAGQKVDGDEVDLLGAKIKEQAVLARAKSWYLNLHNLSEEARDSKFGFFETLASSFSSELRGLPDTMIGLIGELQEFVITRHEQIKTERHHDAQPGKAGEASILRQATQLTEQHLEDFLTSHQLREKFKPWIEGIDRQRTRTAVIRIAANLAILIGTGVGAGLVGNVVAASVRGAMLADAASSSMGLLWATRVANVTGAVAGVAADAAINATVQTATSDGSFRDAFVDNFLASGAVRVALAPLHKVAVAYGGTEKELANLGLWERNLARGKSVLRSGAVLTADMITGAAVDYVVHRVRNGERPDEKTAMDWALQGGSMAIGAFVGRWLHGFESRLTTMAEHGATLRRRAQNMKQLATRVQNIGDADAAMELLIQRHDALEAEASQIHDLAAHGKIDARTAGTLDVGNRADKAAVESTSFGTMPLRLAGLTPDDASGKVWAGSTEDIAIALDQAHRSGLSVKVLAHDAGARQWKIQYNGEELTVIETELKGQPRKAKENPTDADRQHAVRYAQSAQFMQAEWENMQKAEIDRSEVIQFEHLQLGFAFGGAVNQATLPVTGDGLNSKIVIYDHPGTLSKRGDQELGQEPSKFNAPGVRTTEQAPQGTEWTTSNQFNRALDVGRLETQARAYRGTAVALEPRPKGDLAVDPANPDAWKAPNRKFRVKIRDGQGTERWFYIDRFDNLGGLGPGKTSDARAVAGAALDRMIETGQVLRADDPDYTSKLRGGRVLIWGGSPSGAWAAEPAMKPQGADVTILGDTRPPSDWPTLLREYQDINEQIASHQGEVTDTMKARKAAIEAMITRAHSGMTLRRNTKPGASYEKAPTAKHEQGEIKIEFGSPTRIAPARDGGVLVTVGDSEREYDQIVLAQGQDPGAPGAPGGLLGKGARGDAAVPEGTIALRPIYGPPREGHAPEILGLESIDPPGIQLKGAAFANKRMAPWVEQSERKRFTDAVDAIADEHAVTRDYGKVGDDSRGVSGGMEVQRDRIPRANEVLGAKAYRLPGLTHTLELDPSDHAKWDDQVRDYFTENLRANGKWVRVKRLGGGKSSAVVYRVWVDDNDVGVFKLFDHNGAATEQKMLQLLQQAKLEHMQPVRERGVVKVSDGTGFDGALLMDAAKGSSVKDMLEALPKDARRVEEMKKLDVAVKQVAIGLAEMHAKLASGGMMTKEAMLSDANYLLDANFKKAGWKREKVEAALGTDVARVRERLEEVFLPRFLESRVPATAYHGDANAGNFIMDGYDQGTKRFKNVGLIDVGSMDWSIGADGKGNKTGAADVARFLSSLETLAPGALSAGELGALRDEFRKAYFKEYEQHHAIDRTSYEGAEKWYALELQIAILRGDPSTKPQLMSLLGLDGTP